MSNEFSSENLRNAIFILAANKRSEKVEQKIQQQVNLALKVWESILYGYVNVTSKLSTLTDLAVQQEEITSVRKALKDCNDLTKEGTKTVEEIMRLVKLTLPISTVDQNLMTSILNQDKLVGEIKESLSSLVMFSSNKEAVDVVKSVISQIAELQNMINVLSTKINEIVSDSFRQRSDYFNALVKPFEEEELDDDDINF